MDIKESEVRAKAVQARQASRELSCISTEVRNAALLAMADALVAQSDVILRANELDVIAARSMDTPEPLIDRLLLTEERISAIAEALRVLEKQKDPIGEIIEERTLYNGIELSAVRVPLGVVAMIYEARPNVTADAAGLCIKTANACILRGGSMAVHSNLAISRILAESAEQAGIPQGSIQSIEDTSREATSELMSLHGLIDVLIPRGGAGLIKNCVENSKVPVIETGVGNCHIYLHESADHEKALAICINAKCQRPGVCNAAESLLVDESIADVILPPILTALVDRGIRLHCDEYSLKIAQNSGIEGAVPAVQEDWGREYLDLEMSVKCVRGLDEAIAHINTFGTMHSEAIIAEDDDACERFLQRIDAAAVYANASTRFTDGGEFGLGAEIGISTQKLHARGPMGLVALCSYKYVLRGDGQIR
ncbi:MAG: glutamate-5-semialdehyde dehydrogenase [Actinobacteria bacterium]|nr:glutamate-5-semialdehyde dehydrogenase [Actinomycetota bacterium]